MNIAGLINYTALVIKISVKIEATHVVVEVVISLLCAHMKSLLYFLSTGVKTTYRVRRVKS